MSSGADKFIIVTPGYTSFTRGYYSKALSGLVINNMFFLTTMNLN